MTLSKPLKVFGVHGYEQEIFEVINRRYRLPLELTPRPLVEAFPGKGETEAICVFVNEKIDESLLVALKGAGVRLILLRSKGLDNVDRAAAQALGIEVMNTEYGPDSIVEHTIALILLLARKLKLAWLQTRMGDFRLEDLVGMGLRGRTAGIVGTGSIGKGVLRVLKALGMHTLAYDPYPDPNLAALGVQYLPMTRLFQLSDVVSLHCPPPEGDRYLVPRSLIRHMPRGALLVNTARGKLLDTKAALEAIEEGRLGGLGLDVYEGEDAFLFQEGVPLNSDPLLESLVTYPNVILTSHQAFLSDHSIKILVDHCLRTYKHWMERNSG